jgi:hypothetical protein
MQQVHRLSQRRVARLIPVDRMTLRYLHHRDPQEALRVLQTGLVFGFWVTARVITISASRLSSVAKPVLEKWQLIAAGEFVNASAIGT